MSGSDRISVLEGKLVLFHHKTSKNQNLLWLKKHQSEAVHSMHIMHTCKKRGIKYKHKNMQNGGNQYLQMKHKEQKTSLAPSKNVLT